jgi:hypothetical protein
MFKDKIHSMLTPDTRRVIQEFKEEPLRKVVYTSFDGDDMHHMLTICNQVLKHNMIALNPEMALGYYISTETLGGKKINVMIDCLTLAIFSDRLWVYGKTDTLLSEGIMAEIFLWSQIKNRKATFVPNIYGQEQIEMNYLEVKEWLEKMTDEKFRNDIFDSLLIPYKAQSHSTVYIGANFANYKHIDWARVQAYKEKLCPISPQNILSYFLYRSFEDNDVRYLKDRLTLLSKSDMYWLCIDSTNLEAELNKLDQSTLAELYMLNTVYTNKTVKIVDWGDIKVPKYDKSKMWALTTKEQEEILGSNWPIEFRK